MANFDTGTLTTSVTIPLTGNTRYVRLWTLFPTGWVYTDYTYGTAP